MTTSSIPGWVGVASMLAFAAGGAGAWAYRMPAESGGRAAIIQVKDAAKDAAKDVKDFWIKTKIHSQFAMEDALEGSNIDVDITRGAVTLNGTVASAAAKTRAEAIARGTDGVKGVTNNLTVGTAEKAIDPQKVREAGRNVGRMVTDGYVKSAIYAKFLMEKSLEDSDINIDVKNGVVTLKGTVPTEAGRTKAVEVARNTAGVKNVNDTLKIG